MAGNNGLQDVRTAARMDSTQGQDVAHARALAVLDAVERVAIAIEAQTQAITNLIARFADVAADLEDSAPPPRTYMDGTPIDDSGA